jgi:acyl-CoA synthetase (AMP-forming)/AMP-acid ligase II
VIKTFFQLVKIGFLSPISLISCFKANKNHGQNICLLLEYSALRFVNRIAFIDDKCTYTFAEVYSSVKKLATEIHELLPADSRPAAVLLCSYNVSQIITFFALQYLGLKTVLINEKIHPEEQKKIISKIPGPILVFANKEKETDLFSVISIEELLFKSIPNTTFVKPAKAPSRVVFPTSGTSGVSKLIAGKTGVFYWLRSFADLSIKTEIYRNQGVCIGIPFSHGFGYTAFIFAMALGKKMMFLKPGNIHNCVTIFEKYGIDAIVGVPSSLMQICLHSSNKLRTIKTVISGGSSFTEGIYKKISTELCKNIFSLYGSTETSVSFIANSQHLEQNIAALGVPLKGAEYRTFLLDNGSLELQIRSHLSNVSDTWFATGDIVDYEPNGLLYWKGRKDRMLIKNGINIYPEEIENILQSFSKIEDAVVMGKCNAEGYLELTAFVKLFNDSKFNEAEIIQYLKSNLTSLKIPKFIIPVADISYTQTGKKQMIENTT